MKVIFLTLVQINSIDERGIYQDLLRHFYQNGHEVTIVCPVERRFNKSTQVIDSGAVKILQVKTLNIQKTNFIEKGIGTLALEYQVLNAVKKHLTVDDCDLVLYATPPITFNKVINYIKQKSNAFSYLLLKDIFPQNAVDLGLIKKDGFLYSFFRKKEVQLYKISDAIGCMSPANVEYVIEHNPDLNREKLEVNPNSIEPLFSESSYSGEDLFVKYRIPKERLKLIYGGNLGIPQGLDFLLETITCSIDKNVFFIIVGDGTEFKRIEQWFKINSPTNALLLKSLPKKDYDQLVNICDVGLIFLNNKFTIPNFPSRLLSYLEAEIPVLAATDAATDFGNIIEENKCGFTVRSGDQSEMQTKIKQFLVADLAIMGSNGKELLMKEYTVERSYQNIMERLKNRYVS